MQICIGIKFNQGSKNSYLQSIKKKYGMTRQDNVYFRATLNFQLFFRTDSLNLACVKDKQVHLVER